MAILASIIEKERRRGKTRERKSEREKERVQCPVPRLSDGRTENDCENQLKEGRKKNALSICMRPFVPAMSCCHWHKWLGLNFKCHQVWHGHTVVVVVVIYATFLQLLQLAEVIHASGHRASDDHHRERGPYLWQCWRLSDRLIHIQNGPVTVDQA